MSSFRRGELHLDPQGFVALDELVDCSGYRHDIQFAADVIVHRECKARVLRTARPAVLIEKPEHAAWGEAWGLAWSVRRASARTVCAEKKDASGQIEVELLPELDRGDDGLERVSAELDESPRQG